MASKGKQEEEKKEEKAEPAVVQEVELDMPLKRTASAKAVKKALSDLSFFTEVKEDESSVLASVVETRDINKNPYLYYEFNFTPSGIHVKYTVTPEVNADQRRVYIAKSLLGTLSLVGDAYGVRIESFYGFMQKALDEASKNVNQDYQQLLNKHDALKKENSALKESKKKLKNSYEELNNSFLELEKRNEVLRERVGRLEGMTNNELKEELQRWILEHDGAIRYSDFAKTYNIPQTRVEEGINMLLKEGYLTRSSA